MPTRVRTTSPSGAGLDRDHAVARAVQPEPAPGRLELDRAVHAGVVVGRRAPHVEPRPVEREVAEAAQHARWRGRSARARARAPPSPAAAAAPLAAARARPRASTCELAPGDLVAGGRPRLVGGEHRPHGQPRLAARGRQRRAARPRRSRPRAPRRRRARPRRPATPSSSSVHGNARCDEVAEVVQVRDAQAALASPVMRTGSITFLNSSSPGDGVRSGNSRPSATKLPSCSGSPKSPP